MSYKEFHLIHLPSQKTKIQVEILCDSVLLSIGMFVMLTVWCAL